MTQRTKAQQAIYTTVETWQEACLIEDGALFTNDARWSAKALAQLQQHLEESPARTFDEKWRVALSSADQALHALLLEVLYIYYLFPKRQAVRYDTKVRKLMELAQAAAATAQLETVLLPLQDGLSYTDVLYNTRKYDEVLYIIQFARALKDVSKKKRRALLNSPWEGLKRLLIEVRQTMRKDVHMPNIVAHFIAPTYYACIASSQHKGQIVDAFKHHLKHDEEDIDRQLYDIRQELLETADEVDFYASPFVERWQRLHTTVAEAQPLYDDLAPLSLDDFVFEDAARLQAQIMTALRSGKHIILTGPPGTGKSKLATHICEQLKQSYMRVTATANWSAYDTIGGYRPTATGQLQFSPGVFLQALAPVKKWLVIDELNRANIDDVFGPLFSVLAGDAATLPYEAANGQLVTITPEADAALQGEHVYTVSRHWRIIGTMNTSDKASLFHMSYAFMRRFAFIPVYAPQHITAERMQHYLRAWHIAYSEPGILASVWHITNMMRPIGPAIIEDIARYIVMSGNDDMTSALTLYVVPQLEGVAMYAVEQWLTTLATEHAQHIDVAVLRRFCEHFLQLEPPL